jgi:hypothetical protein
MLKPKATQGVSWLILLPTNIVEHLRKPHRGNWVVKFTTHYQCFVGACFCVVVCYTDNKLLGVSNYFLTGWYRVRKNADTTL